MKMNSKDFAKYVNSIRDEMPTTNNGRRVVVLSEETKKGQEILAIASRYEGTDLRQIYDSWSDAKEQAFNEVYEMFFRSIDCSSFSICSHNTFSFTVSWLAYDGCHYVTPTTEYLVIFNE